MSLFLSLLGVAMMVTGLAAIYSGSLFVSIERGWTMVVAGSIGFSAGAVLLGIAAALRRLKRIERAIKLLAGIQARRPVIETLVDAEPGPGSEAASAAPDSEASAASERGPEAKAEAAQEKTSDSDARSETVIGTYRAGGNAYVMYADGSIRADTPSGEHRFASMDEFKAFMLTGTMRARPPEEPQKLAASAGADSDKPAALSAKA